MKFPACYPTVCASCAASRPCAAMARVFMCGIDEVRGRVFDLVLLPGLCEGLFPSRAHEDPILLDVYRAKLAQPGLRLQDDRVADERRRLHIACAAARTRLVFSYPRMDTVESRPRVPSFYAFEIVRAAHGRLPELRGSKSTPAGERPRAWIGPRRRPAPKPSTMPNSIWPRWAAPG